MWHSQHVRNALASKNRHFSFAAPYGNTGEFIAVVITLMEQVSAVRGQSSTCEATWQSSSFNQKRRSERRLEKRNGPVSTSMCALLVTVTSQRLLFCLIILDYIFLRERQMPHWLFIWEAILSLHNYPVLKGLHAWVGPQDPVTQTTPKSLRFRWILDFSTTEIEKSLW